MKKTKFMRAALLLLVLTLITSCFVGGTFAKYTTSSSGSDKARVAYWGFNQAAVTEIKLFNTTYDNGNVNSSITDNVIAPGTSQSSTFAFGYANYKTDKITAPEVAYTFKVSTTGSSCAQSIKDNTNIKWYLDKELAPASGTAIEGSWDALLAAIEALDGNKTNDKYDAGSLPEAFKDANVSTHEVGWKWAFETTGEKMVEQDTTDTDMGNATNLANDLANVTLKITVTATQID